MNLNSTEEASRIGKTRETNDKLEEFFNTKRSEWNSNVEPLFKVLALDISNPTSTKEILNAQSLALSYRQILTEQINYFLNKRSKETTKIKNLRHEKFVFYATGFGIKTNLGEKGILIDAHIAENDRSLEIIESYISYMRDTSKNLESLSYAIKSMVELFNYLGR
jgi:hypothetical protein